MPCEDELGWYCRIYSPLHGGKCGNFSNGGISTLFDEVFLVVDSQQTIHDVESDNPDIKYAQNRPKPWDGKTPKVHITRVRDYIRAEPVDRLPADHVGWMTGGSYILAGKRFIPLHDRSESSKMNRMMSI